MADTFRDLLTEHNITIRDFADRFGIPVRTVENWSRGANTISEYYLNLFRFAMANGYQKPAYFCNAENCGRTFDLANPKAPCPYCGGYEVYPNTPEGKEQSVRDLIKYESALIERDDE